MRAVFVLIRILTILFAVDLVFILATGHYTVPFTGIRSEHPATSVFAILALELARRMLLAASRGERSKLLDSDTFVFLLVWAVFFLNFRWRGAGDVVGASLTPFTILQDGDLYLEEYRSFVDPWWAGSYEVGGHVLTKYSSAAGILLLPFYLVPGLAGVVPTDLLIHQLQKIGASFLVALSAWILLRTLLRHVSRRWAVTLAIGYALGTSSLSTSSQAIWQHGPSQLFLSLGLFFVTASSPRARLDLRGVGAGFAFAMAVWIRYTDALLYLAVLVFLLFRARDRLPGFVVGSILPFAALAADNALHTGSFLQTGYGEEAGHFVTPFWTGFAGLLVSPGRGLFLFSPFLLFSVLGLGIAWTRPGHSLLRFVSVGCLAVVLLYSKWHAWAGGWCFGPRMLADLTPFLVFAIHPVVPWLERTPGARLAFHFTLVLSALLHFLGAALTWWWEDVDGFWSWDRHPFGYLLLRAGTTGEPDQVIAHWGAIALLTGVGVWMLTRIVRERAGSGEGCS